MDERTLKLETALTQIAKLLAKEEKWSILKIHKSADDSLEISCFGNLSIRRHVLTDYRDADCEEGASDLGSAVADLAVFLDTQAAWTDVKFNRLREDDAIVTILAAEKDPSYRLLSAHYPGQAGLTELGFRVMEFR